MNEYEGFDMPIDNPEEVTPETDDISTTLFNDALSDVVDETPETDIATEEPEIDEKKSFSFDEYFTTPEEFESTDDAVKWYQNQMDVLRNELMNPENGLTRQYIDNYVSSRLIEEEERVQGFAEAYNALMANPKEYLMQYVPEALVSMGIEPVKTPEEINAITDQTMKQEFGDDYMNRFNPNELIRHDSYSTQLLNRRSAIAQELEAENKQNQELFQNWNKNITNGKSNLPDIKAMKAEEQINYIKETYAEKFTKEYNMSESAFDKFTRDVAQRQITLEDLHRVQYFEGYMKQAYQRGLEDAKSGLYNKLNSEGNATKRTAQSAKPTVKPQQASFIQSLLSQDIQIPQY